MKKFSWYTDNEKDSGGWYKCVSCLKFPKQEVSFEAYPYFKPNRKGGYNRKDSHLLNVEGKNLLGKRWTKYKKNYNPKLTLFNGMPKRFWLKLELTKIYFSMMSFVRSQVINEISQTMLNRKKQGKNSSTENLKEE